MSIINCKYCGGYIDTDFDAEHEDICEDKPCETCDSTGKVAEGQFDDIREIDCPDCKIIQ